MAWPAIPGPVPRVACPAVGALEGGLTILLPPEDGLTILLPPEGATTILLLGAVRGGALKILCRSSELRSRQNHLYEAHLCRQKFFR